MKRFRSNRLKVILGTLLIGILSFCLDIHEVKAREGGSCYFSLTFGCCGTGGTTYCGVCDC